MIGLEPAASSAAPPLAVPEIHCSQKLTEFRPLRQSSPRFVSHRERSDTLPKASTLLWNQDADNKKGAFGSFLLSR